MITYEELYKSYQLDSLAGTSERLKDLSERLMKERDAYREVAIRWIYELNEKEDSLQNTTNFVDKEMYQLIGKDLTDNLEENIL